MSRYPTLRTLAASLLVWMLTTVGCARTSGEHDGHTDHDDHEPASTSGQPTEAGLDDELEGTAAHGDRTGDIDDHQHGEVRLPLAGLRGLGFTRVGAPQEEGFWAPAEAVSDADAVAVVSAPAAGIVRRLLVRTGEPVRAGQTVAELASAEVADVVARHRRALAEVERATAEAEREEALLAADATSRREVEAARGALAVARAEAEAARQSLAARGVDPTTFTGTLALDAPAAGTLEGWQVVIGEGVEAGTALATIRDREATRVRAELAPPGPSDWAVGSTTEVRRGDGTRWTATVEGLPAGLTVDTRRYAYLLRLASAPFPSPGTPLEVRVPLARGIVVPQEALQIIEGDWGVFVREGGEVVFHRVRRGAELGGDVLILGGIDPGLEVATAGAYLLRPLWMKRMGGGEQHAH